MFPETHIEGPSRLAGFFKSYFSHFARSLVSCL